MRVLWISLGLGLLACAPSGSVKRVVVGSVGPKPPATPPVVQPVAPEALLGWSNRQGLWPGPAPLRRPDVEWTSRLPGPVVHPLTTDGRAIYAVANGNVYAVDTTGVTRWTAEVQATGPAVASEVGILVPCKSGGLTLLAPKTGAVIRQTSAAGPTHAMPVFLEGVMAWVTTEGVLATSDGGRQRVTSAAMSDIASDGTRIFVGTAKGEFFAIDRTGILWQRSLPGPAVAHPIVTKDMVYMTFGPHEGEPGGVTALGRKDGLTKWTSTMRMGPAAGPALGEVLLVPGKSGELVALDPRSGGTRWRAPGYGAYSVKPVIVGETAFAGNADGRLHRVDLHDGGEVWAVELGATITGDPVLVDGRLVVGLTDGRLVSLR